MEIIWKGNQYTNSNERVSSSGKSYIPFIIVDHISAGTMSSMDSWFTSSGNTVSSAHFGVAKDGRIHQYVDMRRMAWANGSSPAYYPKNVAQVITDNYGINPNLYSVSIEHEGTDGNLTEAQFNASVWLHNYIRDKIVEIYGSSAWFELDSYHVIGHYQIHTGKPSCPGPYFPWNRLYEALKNNNNQEDEGDRILMLEDWKWDMLASKLNKAYQKSVAGELVHPVLSDYSWVEQAYNRTLKLDDAVWLLFIIAGRGLGIETMQEEQ